jgi:hypothetical protein
VDLDCVSDWRIIVIPLTDLLSRVFSFRIYAHVLAATGL